ncbi:hypothetical protein Taro_051078 [Colocasia esculenta]|uniref:Uncharacterized protein n=1 Tax=Colocasia esculenta TaxID=4460 RepID=A0A843XFS1_COLES|nr:hypothetical protein [Colocasia esculenta]
MLCIANKSLYSKVRRIDRIDRTAFSVARRAQASIATCFAPVWPPVGLQIGPQRGPLMVNKEVPLI